METMNLKHILIRNCQFNFVSQYCWVKGVTLNHLLKLLLLCKSQEIITIKQEKLQEIKQSLYAISDSKLYNAIIFKLSSNLHYKSLIDIEARLIELENNDLINTETEIKKIQIKSKSK